MVLAEHTAYKAKAFTLWHFTEPHLPALELGCPIFKMSGLRLLLSRRETA